MNEMLIKNWNDRVQPEDRVFHLGDVALGSIVDSLPLVGRLNGYKILVPGNHDRIWSTESEAKRTRFDPEYKKVFQEVWPQIANGAVKGVPVRFSHLPFTGDSHSPEDRYRAQRPTPVSTSEKLVCGHVHEKWKVKGRQVNVGVDVWSYSPVHEDELAEILNGMD